MKLIASEFYFLQTTASLLSRAFHATDFALSLLPRAATYEQSDTRYEIRYTGYEIRDTSYELKDSRYIHLPCASSGERVTASRPQYDCTVQTATVR
jgi:hypothetical protein